MQQAAAQQAAAQQQQIAEAREQAEAQRVAQEKMLADMKANTPAPSAQVVQGETDTDIRKQAAQRRGMRRSLLAGESSQAPVTTGTTTLG
jgi:hypothetical protein